MADPNDLSLFGISNSAQFKVKRPKKFEILRKKKRIIVNKERKKNYYSVKLVLDFGVLFLS